MAVDEGNVPQAVAVAMVWDEGNGRGRGVG